MKIFDHKSGHYLEISGNPIYFEARGNKNNPVLLMLHGGVEDIENLNSIASYLSENFYLIGIDSRGHGKSHLGNEKLTYERLQCDVEAVLHYLKINTINILGFSDGGIVAYRIATSKKVQVEKLITLGASWSNNDVLVAEEMITTITPESAKEIFPENYQRYQQLNSAPNFDLLIQSVVAMWLDRTDTGYPNERVQEITAKTLLIRGDNDFLVSLESLAELKGKIKDVSLLNVPFAEHVVYEEQPEIVEIILKQFLRK